MLELLAVFVGLTLGLLGGGGSILAVPLLLYGAGMEPKTAIASSLAIVAVTSAASVWLHARQGHVRWSVGLIFGASGMLGAFAGGHVAQFLPAWTLILGFAFMMLATAAAMLRRPRDKSSGNGLTAHRPPWLFAAEGAIVGLVTGMVGAGGGFLVVPALVLGGRISMRDAIGTSLLVIALKSTAGFAGYATHTAIDYALVGELALFTSLGALLGSRIGRAFRPTSLRATFGWFMAAMSVYMIHQQMPVAWTEAELFQRVFVERWPWWAGGAGIGLFALVFLWHDNRLLGISTGYAEICRMRGTKLLRDGWRPRFLLGIVLGGALAGAFSGQSQSVAMETFDLIWSDSLVIKALVLTGAGVLIGYGARAAGGCTSGHAIVGVAQGAKSSLIATALFMVAGISVTHLVNIIAGVSP